MHRRLSLAEKVSREQLAPRNQLKRGETRRITSSREEQSRPPLRNQYQQRSQLSRARDGEERPYHSYRSLNRQEWQRKDHYNSDRSRHSAELPRTDYYREEHRKGRGDSHSASSPKSFSRPRHVAKETEASPPRYRDLGSKEDVTDARNHLNSKNQGIPCRRRRDKTLPQDAMDEAIGEVQSAARRERVRLAEAKGQIEESAAQIVRASLTRKETADSQTGKVPSSEDRVPIAARLGQLPLDKSIDSTAEQATSKDQNERIPIVNRLGPHKSTLVQDTQDSIVPEKAQKRKPGRPPGKRRVNGSPSLLPGASSKKRKVQQTKQPNCRKKLQIEGNGKSAKAARGKGDSARVGAKKVIAEAWVDDPDASVMERLATTRSAISAWNRTQQRVASGSLFLWIIWNLWKSRNWFVFEGFPSRPEDVLTTAIKMAREWSSDQNLEIVHHKGEPRMEQPSPCDAIVVRTDAAWEASRQVAGLGWIRLGRPTNQTFKGHVEFVTSPLMAEALALRDAILTCKRMKIKKLRFESDSAQLIKIVNSKSSVPELHGVVSDILACSLAFEFVCFVWIPRERNTIADLLAKDALIASVQCVVVGVMPTTNSFLLINSVFQKKKI
ncbi:hypothetical protein IGI04_030083 [Brassica rapa subsp. trilocularis]|uniref:RNase H type-1 domain-containing protein n=1 Tax=Brassica rapa subsp. trilocularis TaxID=1813537 RepID=A0ABQ7LQJ1_BRACM|nr:hypothetical protein IGI04_030083 [Brassica rapa subsp. trilocularis]